MKNLESEQGKTQKELKDLQDSKKHKHAATRAATLEDSDQMEQDQKDKFKDAEQLQAGDDDLQKEMISQTQQDSITKDPHPEKSIDQVQENIEDTTNQLNTTNEEIKNTSDKLNQLEQKGQKDTPSNSLYFPKIKNKKY